MQRSARRSHQLRGLPRTSTETPQNKYPDRLLATQRPASQIERFEGFPDVIDFKRDIQPILDRHCVECHTYKAGRQSDLGRRSGPALVTRLLQFVRPSASRGRSQWAWQSAAAHIGSSASALLKKVDGSHYEVQVTPQEWRTLWLWIESGAAYAGTYAALRTSSSKGPPGRPLSVFAGNRK